MNCRICGHGDLQPLGVEGFLFPVRSYAPDFHVYDNYICPGCGVVSGQPEPGDAALGAYYENAYRTSRDALTIGGKLVDTPIDLGVGGRSVARAKSFHDLVVRNAAKFADAVPGEDDLVIDFGAYQGLFLHGVRQLWGCRCLAYDHSENGIAFARDYLGFELSRVTEDIYRDTFGERARFATMIHSLEHLREPLRFLEHLKADVLTDDGYLYIEVPNLYGMALCDPTHFFTYSEQSLRHLLECGGFEVIDIAVQGFPAVPEFVARNDEQNIVCLARPARGSAATGDPAPAVDTDAIRRLLRRSYARHSNTAIGRQFRAALGGTAKFFYYLAFAGILDRISPRLSALVLKSIGRRREP